MPVGMENIQAGYYTVGENNRIFAFMGVPVSPMPEGGYPAVILVHGGAGYAYYEWVKKWTDNGYVAIAPDFDAHYPTGTDYNQRYTENPNGGPHGSVIAGFLCTRPMTGGKQERNSSNIDPAYK